jgi:hypothetical protein
MENLNSRNYLDKCRAVCLENLRYIEAAPSVEFHYVPPDAIIREADGAAARAAARAEANSRGNGIRGMLDHSTSITDKVAAGIDEDEERELYVEGRREDPGEAYEGEFDQDADTQGIKEASEAILAQDSSNEGGFVVATVQEDASNTNN